MAEFPLLFFSNFLFLPHRLHLSFRLAAVLQAARIETIKALEINGENNNKRRTRSQQQQQQQQRWL